MRQSTIADYNSKDRAVEWRIDIYFNGPGASPLRCTRKNYLIDCSLLDEACADSDSFIGTPSSNELSFQLFGSRGMFSPTDATGPYYGKIKAGVMIKVYCRPISFNVGAAPTHDELSIYTHGSLANFTHNEIMNFDGVFGWDALGTFYVTEWLSDLTGVTAEVTACDALYKLFNSAQSIINVVPNYSYEDLITDFFGLNGYIPIITGDLSELLSFAYIDGDNSTFIKDFSIGALAYIYCNHNGSIVVFDIDTHDGSTYTITDSDQVISVTSKQSAMLEHSGVRLEYSKMQVSDEQLVLSNKAEGIAGNGVLALSAQSLQNPPVYAISHVVLDSDANCFVDNIKANPYYISYDVLNASNLDASVNINIYGFTIESILTIISDDTSNDLKLSSKYIQNEEYAEHISDLLHKYITLPVPILELEVRGNPLFAIGDTIHVISNMYNIDFTGILIRQNFTYNGGMSASMSLLSTEIVGA